jgi:hypothetical protein
VSLPTPRSSGRWTPEYASTILDAFDNSKLSLAEFARQRGLDTQRIRWWRNQMDRSEGPRLVELVVKAASPPTPTAGVADALVLRIRCPSGHVLELAECELERSLVAVLRALREAGC